MFSLWLFPHLYLCYILSNNHYPLCLSLSTSFPEKMRRNIETPLFLRIFTSLLQNVQPTTLPSSLLFLYTIAWSLSSLFTTTVLSSSPGKMRRNADNWSHVSATLVPDSPSKVPSMGYVPKGEYLLPLAFLGSWDTVKTNKKSLVFTSF